MQCASCKKEIDRGYWFRALPEAWLCKDCWQHPEKVNSKILRDAIAHEIWEARKKNRAIAVEMLKGLRGRGVPTNPRRHGGDD